MGKVIAAYGGGFKPPTKGHLEIVQKALNAHPEIDEFIIYVGGKERDGISQTESLLIWDIFKKYLPMKVKIEPSKLPIGDIIRLGKNNPDDKVYFVIGGRKGRQDDLDDIANRTKNIEQAYPNMEIKVHQTEDKGMSGTNARKATKISAAKLSPFLPDELTDSEKEEVFNILRPIIKEEISKSQLDSIEAYADKLFAKLGIDIEFTKHFLDRVNDKRNIKPISVPELVGMFKRLHRKHGKPLSKVDDDFNAVVKDFNSNINIPFAINVTDDDIEMYAKTVMRKKDFKTSTPVIALNENASYQKDINLIEKLATLTQHMLDKGMNIEPLPNLEFVNGDSENARDFFGKTAYYNPTTQTIVLYTEGRHPKDIARSYTHEMIHHIQNLEGRLGNITTTNTQEDDDLNKIEAEANLKGTMTFRNWTDSLNEAIVGDKIECDKCGWNWKMVDGGNDLFICHKCGNDNTPLNEAKPYKHKHGFDDKLGKDPFGLSQFAREIAEGVLNEGKYDSLVTKLAGYTINAWKGDFEDGQPKGYFELEIGPGKEFDYPHLMFKYIAKARFVDYFKSSGLARPRMKMPEVELMYFIPSDELPRMWEQISMDIRNTIRHEIEHLMQSGPNVKKGKEMGDDSSKRDELKTGKKPWWKIWRKKLGTPDYYKLEKEIDANLQGLYLKAKKTRQPLEKVIDLYLRYDLNLPIDDREDIKTLWKKRAPKLNIPLEENTKKILIPEEEVVSSPPMEYKIYSDMDGVITDFNTRYKKYAGMMPSEYEKKFGKDKFWELADAEGVAFWVGMPWMEDGKDYWNYIKDYNVELLSSPSRSETSRLGKRLWVRNNLPGIKLTLAQAYNKKNYAEPNHILIDDRKSNIEQWKEAGGIGILHTSANDTINQLKALGL